MADTPNLAAARVLVVGASAGIGRALARHAIVREGRVCIAGRRADRLMEVTGARPIQADLRRPDDCRRLVDEAVAHLGGLDLLVHSAGVGTLARMEHIDVESWRNMYEVNALGPALVTAAALPHLSPDAIVVFLSSEATGQTRWGLGGYAASKAALDTSIRHWRVEHPERRFLRIEVGATTGTEFGDGFGAEVLGTAFDRWISTGIQFEMMDVDALAQQMIAVLTVALAHPAIDVPDLVLDPRRAGWEEPHTDEMEQS